jgi:hypothetical protein
MAKKNTFARVNAAALILQDLNKASEEPTVATIPDIDLMIGGQWFVDALCEHGITEQGKLIRLSEPLLEIAELIGDFRVGSTALTGAAQVFKSLITWNLAAALVTVGKSRIGWVMPQANMIHKLVPTYWLPIIAHWEEQLGVSRKLRSTDSKSREIYQSAYGSARFIGARNPSEKQKTMDGLADTAVQMVAASIDAMLADERSQFPAGAITVLGRRMEQSEIASKPWRITGTPGAGAGIEDEISKADRDFYSYVECRSCGEVSALHPLGWLLKSKIVDGEECWFDPQGRPLDWHRRDEGDPIRSSYFGCPNCGEEISKDDRLESWFECQKTGQSLRDFLDDLPTQPPWPQLSAGATLSPLIRDTDSNTASSVLKDGIEGHDPYDWQQQSLGIATSATSGGITIKMIEQSINRLIPNQAPTAIGYGIDQGHTHGHWVVKVKFYRPNDLASRSLSKAQLYEKTHREIVFAAPMTKERLEGDDGTYLLADCEGGAIDNEPERDFAAKFSIAHPGCLLFDQRGERDLGGKIWAPRLVQSAGKDLEVFGVDTHRIQSKILGCFAGAYYTISCPCDPQDTKGEKSLTRHLISSTRERVTGKWSRPADKVDDLLKGLLGAELWWYLYSFGELPSSGDSFWSAAENIHRQDKGRWW